MIRWSCHLEPVALCLLQFVGLLPRALGVRATPGGHYALRRSQYVGVLHAHLGHQRLGAEVKNNLHASEGRHPPARPTPDIPAVMVALLHSFCDQDLLVKEACVF